jgi:acyl-CoA synthetase (AMP-forming)/AMP-acid ligase II
MGDKEPRSKPTNFLEIHAANQPDKKAIIGLKRSLTFGQLRERARALAKSLYGLGIRPGDQVAIMSYNLPESAELSSALVYLEVGLVRIGYHMKPPEIEFIVDNSDSKMVIFWHEFAERILPHKIRYQKVLADGFISFGGPSMEGSLDFESLIEKYPDMDLDGLQPADKPGNQMIYTSGTTGRPKGATRKTDFVNKPGVMEYLMATINFLKMDQNEVHLVCCPLYHSGPNAFANFTFILGGTSVYQSRFDAEQFLEFVDKYKVTSSLVVPTIVTRLLDVPEKFTKNLNLTTMRSIICGSAPLYPDHKLSFLDRYGPCLYEYYGATETGFNTFITPDEIRKRPSSVGKAFANNELKIYDDSGNEVADCERGVLYMYNSVMMDGYYKNQKATSDSKRGKYLTAGDVAIRDSDGYYYIVDRIKDMIIRGGVNIYPAEIERVLSTMPDIADAAVVGKPNNDLGETVAAFIVRKDGAQLSENEILEYCKEKMANYKVPAMIIFIDEIPRTLTGKIMKKELRQKLETSA